MPFADLDSEHHSVYEIDANFIHNEDMAHDGDTPHPHEAAAPDGLTAVEGTNVSTGNVAGEDGDETNRAAA